MFTINRRETGYDSHDVSFLAIEPSGEVVGSAFAALEDGALRLDSIQTNPPKRCRGIGSALLAAVIGWGRDGGATRLTGEFKPDPSVRISAVEKFYRERGISINEDGTLESSF